MTSWTKDEQRMVVGVNMGMAFVWHSMDGDEPCGMRVDGTVPGSVEGVMVLHLKASQERADLTQKRMHPDFQRLSRPS